MFAKYQPVAQWLSAVEWVVGGGLRHLARYRWAIGFACRACHGATSCVLIACLSRYAIECPTSFGASQLPLLDELRGRKVARGISPFSKKGRTHG